MSRRGRALATITGRGGRTVARSFGVRLRAEHAVFPHAVEHVGEPFSGAVGLAVGAEIGWPLGQPGKQRPLVEGKVFRRLAEIAARGDFDAPGAAAEIDAVEIELKDLVLGERGFEPGRDDHLANFALVADIFADQQVLHHLLGDRRASLGPARMGEIADERPD